MQGPAPRGREGAHCGDGGVGDVQEAVWAFTGEPDPEDSFRAQGVVMVVVVIAVADGMVVVMAVIVVMVVMVVPASMPRTEALAQHSRTDADDEQP